MADFGPLVISRGDTVYIDFAVVDANGQATSIVGWTLWFTVKRRLSDTDAQALIQKTTASGITVTSAATGVGYVLLLPADTSGLEARRQTFYADLQGKDAGGAVYTLQHGTLTVRPEPTGSIM